MKRWFRCGFAGLVAFLTESGCEPLANEYARGPSPLASRSRRRHDAPSTRPQLRPGCMPPRQDAKATLSRSRTNRVTHKTRLRVLVGRHDVEPIIDDDEAVDYHTHGVEAHESTVSLIAPSHMFYQSCSLSTPFARIDGVAPSHWLGPFASAPPELTSFALPTGNPSPTFALGHYPPCIGWQRCRPQL